MKVYGIRQAKAHLSHIVRSAAAGVCSIVTDNRRPVAIIGPAPSTTSGKEKMPPAAEKLSDASAFGAALIGAPYPLELDF